MKRVNKMREHHYYECEICHAEYDTEERAIDCESGHIKPVGIVDYRTRWKTYAEYPYELGITFENGKTKTYKIQEDWLYL